MPPPSFLKKLFSKQRSEVPARNLSHHHTRLPPKLLNPSSHSQNSDQQSIHSPTSTLQPWTTPQWTWPQAQCRTWLMAFCIGKYVSSIPSDASSPSQHISTQSHPPLPDHSLLLGLQNTNYPFI